MRQRFVGCANGSLGAPTVCWMRQQVIGCANGLLAAPRSHWRIEKASQCVYSLSKWRSHVAREIFHRTLNSRAERADCFHQKFSPPGSPGPPEVRRLGIAHLLGHSPATPTTSPLRLQVIGCEDPQVQERSQDGRSGARVAGSLHRADQRPRKWPVASSISERQVRCVSSTRPPTAPSAMKVAPVPAAPLLEAA
jgi:hypothetical protein